MLEQLEALRALARAGTMTEAATQLRLSQSAVSKRIASLEQETGRKLIEPAGRRVRLTPAGQRLLERVDPLLAGLKAALVEESRAGEGRIVLAVSESILCSWGPRALAAVKQQLPGLELRLNAHRSLAALDRVRAGDYTLALCAGISDTAPDLKAEPVLEEPLVIVPAGLDRAALEGLEVLPVMTIESHSATWIWVERRLRRLSRAWGVEVRVEHTLQSFPCLVQLARAGFGHVLAPLELARAFGVPDAALLFLPAPGVSRPVSLVGRASAFAQPAVQLFLQALREHLEQKMSGPLEPGCL